MNKFIKKGFTLIELLVVIAILGILATVVLVAVNPVQQLAKTRDSSRITTVAQLGHAMESYGTGNNGVYLPASNVWVSDTAGGNGLVQKGEITTLPAAVTYGSGAAPCTVNVQNGFCYAAGAAGVAPMVIYARLEATANTGKCTATQWAYVVYSSADGRAGQVCRSSGAANEPVTGNQTFVN